MLKKILLVDDDRIMLSLAANKFKKYEKNFTVMTAADGVDALKKLKQDHFSLVVTDLQMPRMDGFSLLANLSERYPEIPVIVLTAYGSQSSKKAILKSGAAGFMEKPFVVEELAGKILESLKKESEGGILQTVPLEMFLQLVEIEQKTCTIRVIDKATRRSGVLFFRNGNLLDARIQNEKGTAAAYEIFSWEKVTLSIQDTCAVVNKRIKEDLQAILMEAMRLKDEAGEAAEPNTGIQDLELESAEKDLNPEESHKSPAKMQPAVPTETDSVQDRLKRLSTERKWLKDVYQDDTWDNLLEQLRQLGPFFDSGEINACYVNQGDVMDIILLPGKKTSVVSVVSKCPRDRIMQILSK